MNGEKSGMGWRGVRSESGRRLLGTREICGNYGTGEEKVRVDPDGSDEEK